MIEELKIEVLEQETGNTGDGAYTADLLRRATAEIKRLRALCREVAELARHRLALNACRDRFVEAHKAGGGE